MTNIGLYRPDDCTGSLAGRLCPLLKFEFGRHSTRQTQFVADCVLNTPTKSEGAFQKILLELGALACVAIRSMASVFRQVKRFAYHRLKRAVSNQRRRVE